MTVTLVHCGQTVERIKMKLGMQVGLGPGHIVSDGDPAPSPKGGGAPQFLAHICCVQMAAWIKMPLGVEVGFGPSWGPSSPPQKGAEPPKFSAHVHYSYCDFVRTLHSRYWFVHVLVLCAFYF